MDVDSGNARSPHPRLRHSGLGRSLDNGYCRCADSQQPNPATFAQKAGLNRLRANVHPLESPRPPWYARLLAAAVVAYAFSPIDLIPDPIPILGYWDDLLLVPAGILLARRLIPPVVLGESRAQAVAIWLARLLLNTGILGTG
ncbi:MAG: DUF1232 domain-containing protein [Caldilineaceae bacterium]|nr:DUF1232 domain-containing protein [Caldilineaceae bacterium]